MDAITISDPSVTPPPTTGAISNGHGAAASAFVRPIITLCCECGTDVSPRWYDAPSAVAVVKDEYGRSNGAAREKMCHLCHFHRIEASDAQMDVDV
jgi:hypothetical protein